MQVVTFLLAPHKLKLYMNPNKPKSKAFMWNINIINVDRYLSYRLTRQSQKQYIWKCMSIGIYEMCIQREKKSQFNWFLLFIYFISIFPLILTLQKFFSKTSFPKTSKAAEVICSKFIIHGSYFFFADISVILLNCKTNIS